MQAADITRLTLSLRSPPSPCSALREAVLAQVEGAAPVSGEDGVYRGMNAYKDYRAGFRREHTIGGWGGSTAWGSGMGCAGAAQAEAHVSCPARGGHWLHAQRCCMLLTPVAAPPPHPPHCDRRGEGQWRARPAACLH